VGMVEALSIQGREKTHDILAQDEAVTQCLVPTTTLMWDPKGTRSVSLC
jgi:hypothetical protein